MKIDISSQNGNASGSIVRTLHGAADGVALHDVIGGLSVRPPFSLLPCSWFGLLVAVRTNNAAVVYPK